MAEAARWGWAQHQHQQPHVWPAQQPEEHAQRQPLPPQRQPRMQEQERCLARPARTASAPRRRKDDTGIGPVGTSGSPGEGTNTATRGRLSGAGVRSRLQSSFGGCLRGVATTLRRFGVWVSRHARDTVGFLAARIAVGTTKGPPTRVREHLLQLSAQAAAGRPFVSVTDARLAGSAEAAAATLTIRATRAKRTTDGATRAIRNIREFIEANPTLLATVGPPTLDAWDVAVEAFVYAEASGQAAACPWRRARRPQDPSAARGAASARALLDRLGYTPGAAWTRAKAMAQSFGVHDPEDVRHHPPVFTWELVEGLRLAPAPATPWELAAAALLCIGSLNGRAKGQALSLLVGEVQVVGADTVRLTAGHRTKVMRARATQRQRRQPQPIVLRHWLVERHVIPWAMWHQRVKSPPSALFFPSITAGRTSAATPQGFTASGQWVEPVRQWTDRALAAALAKYVYRLDGRTFHGLRAGNNRELRRREGVSAVTRRSLHQRTLRPVIGSEEAYDAPFAEDYASATQALGSLRIESGKDGLLTVTATSASAGEDPTDWVPVASPMRLAPADNVTSSDSDTSEGGEELDCGRCGKHLSGKDYGWLCDREGCTWGVCTSCFTGGPRTVLLCPAHQSSR